MRPELMSKSTSDLVSRNVSTEMQAITAGTRFKVNMSMLQLPAVQLFSIESSRIGLMGPRLQRLFLRTMYSVHGPDFCKRCMPPDQFDDAQMIAGSNL